MLFREVQYRMTKKLFKLFSFIAIPILIIIAILMEYNKYLDEHLFREYNSTLASTYNITEMNNGLVILKNNAKRGDLILLGTSELSNANHIPQNPANMFPNTDLNLDVVLFGTAGTQSLLDVIKVGALSNDFKGKKIVFFVSLQWFLRGEIDEKGYQSNFSNLQFYEFMDNKNVSEDIKKYVCKRSTSLLSTEAKTAKPCLYSELYSHDNFISKFLLLCLKPYYIFDKKFLTIKDKHNSYKVINEFSNYSRKNIKNINWEEETIKAQKDGEAACTNNSFYIIDSYFNYFSDKLDKMKNAYSKVELLKSNELDDYKVLLDLFKQSNIDPYIVFIPTNGYYYDYTGLTQNKRIELYDELESIADDYGFNYLDLRDKEYEPYFLEDFFHLGWKGWLYVNQKIIEHFS